jgi:hypothetical protein
VDGNNGLRIGARVLVLIAVALPLSVTSGIALADPSLPDPSAPVDAASNAASSAADEASGAVDSATSAADDVVSAASNEAESAADSAVSTAETTAEAASGAVGSASPASQAGEGSEGTSSSGAVGGSPGSGMSPAGSPADSGSVDAPAGESTTGAGERGKVVSRYDGGSADGKANGAARGPDAGRDGGAKQVSQESDSPTRRDDEGDRGPLGDLSDLVQSGQEIGDSTTVSVVTSPDRSDDPPLFEGLPITGFEVSVLFAAGAGLASLGVALLSYARERSASSGRPRLS